MGSAKHPPSRPRSLPRELITNDRWDISPQVARAIATVTVPISKRGHTVPFPPGTLVWLSYSRGTDAMMLTFDVSELEQKRIRTEQRERSIKWPEFYKEHAVEVHEDEIGIVMEINDELQCTGGVINAQTTLNELWLVMHYLVQWSGHPGRPSWVRYDWIVPWADLSPTAGD